MALFMGVLVNRINLVGTYLVELIRQGLPKTVGPVDSRVLFVIDGVGRLQAAPLLVRRTLRELRHPLGTIKWSWQFGLPGEIWTDLMWLRRNRVQGVRLARGLLAFRRAHPATTIHLLAYSGGAGVAVFALEALRGRQVIDTLILGCPALSAGYNLGPALRTVRRAYALVSARDSFILGWGTRTFGTVDRHHESAAGRVGFRLPSDASSEDLAAYERLRQIRWTPALAKIGHHGGHTGWACMGFLRRYLLELLDGNPSLTAEPVE